MTDSQDTTGSRRNASREVREGLLAAPDLPRGAVTVARGRMAEGDTLVIRMIAPDLLPAERRPDCFQGFPVIYQVAEPLKIGQS
jgi:hypothetical protein